MTDTPASASASNGPLNRPSSVPPIPGTQNGLAPWIQQQQQLQQQQQFYNPGYNNQQTLTQETGSTPSPHRSHALAPPKVAVFWDFENCPPPAGMPGYVVVENIRNVTHHFGDVALFKAYLEISDISQSKKSLRSELQSSGVSLTDCPHNGRKDAADKMMMVDMLAFAIDHPPPATIVLISGDRDFVYALSVLRNRRYTVVLIVPNNGAPIILKSQANAILEWRYDVLNQDVWNMQQQQQQIQSMQASSVPTTANSLFANNSLLSNGSTGSAPTNAKMALSETPATAPAATGVYNSKPESEKAQVSYSTVAATNNNGKKNQSLRTQVLTKDIGNDSINSLRVQTNSRPQITVNGDDNIGDIPNDEETKKFADEYVGFVFSPKAPGYFDLLVEVLEKFRLAGEPQPRRSRVGNELLRRNPLLYHRAGCSSFKEYIELAVAEGIVLIGGDKGLAWVTLNEDIRGKLFD